jgi:arylsulfatase A
MTSPHKPLIPSDDFAGRSKAGAYGDVVEELDWGVGEVINALEKHGLTDNTLIIVTSDNGPFPEGSTGGLRGGKGTGWEGGYRVPFIARWPGQIEPGTVSTAMSMNIDLMPTLLSIAGGESVITQELDGKDISPVLHGSNQSPHEVLYFFNNERIAALRTQKWRLMLSDYPPWRDAQPIRFEDKKNLYSLLYDMEIETSQQYDLSRDYPEEKQKLEALLSHGRKTLESLSTQPDSTQFGDSYKN